jgi:hypothetical protein
VANLEQRCLADEKKHREWFSFLVIVTLRDLGRFTGLSWSQGVFNQPWQGTSQYRFPILPRAPEQMSDIQDNWAAIRGQPQEKQYLRYLVIESNLLELTFTLTRNVSSCPFGGQVCVGLESSDAEHQTTDPRRI